MNPMRTLLLVLLVLGSAKAHADTPHKASKSAATEAHNEAAEPSFSSQVREAHRISAQLASTLHLTRQQQHAIEPVVAAERTAQALAVTAADAGQAQQHYLQAMSQLLSASQLKACVAMYSPLTGKPLLSGTAPLVAH